jgi:nucleotide-binding universal stress UspA family protein
MYKKILVPIDAGAPAQRSLREAISVARDQGAEILLLHVVDEWPVAAGDIAAVNLDAGAKALREAGAELLEQAAKQVRDGGVTVQTALIEELGIPVGECVVQRARQWPADLIVCGTHGRRGISRLLLGSNAEYIMHHSPVPVLLLRVPESDHAG